MSPGQACVFYDAADGQARVLGGGFIQSAVAATRRRHARRRRGVRGGPARVQRGMTPICVCFSGYAVNRVCRDRAFASLQPIRSGNAS